MTPAVQVILSGTLTFGVPMVWALRELFTLRPGGGSYRPPPPEPAPPAPIRPQLPACLIPPPRPPRTAPARDHVLEPA